MNRHELINHQLWNSLLYLRIKVDHIFTCCDSGFQKIYRQDNSSNLRIQLTANFAKLQSISIQCCLTKRSVEQQKRKRLRRFGLCVSTLVTDLKWKQFVRRNMMFSMTQYVQFSNKYHYQAGLYNTMLRYTIIYMAGNNKRND